MVASVTWVKNRVPQKAVLRSQPLVPKNSTLFENGVVKISLDEVTLEEDRSLIQWDRRPYKRGPFGLRRRGGCLREDGGRG